MSMNAEIESGPAGAARTVEAGRGVAWWTEAWALFTRNVGLWIVLAVILFVILVVLSIIPLLGSLVAALVVPVFLGGWMLAARKVDQGGTLEIGDLFACFQSDRLTPLLIVGALLLAGVLVLGIVLGVLGAGAVFSLFAGGAGASGAGMAAALGAGMLALFIGLTFGVLLSMVTWFAPALVVFRNVPPVEAFKASFAACLRNIVPFLIWGLLYVVAAVVASIPFGLGWIVLAPVMLLAVYVSYKDVFGV